jgi:hypothetical protein
MDDEFMAVSDILASGEISGLNHLKELTQARGSLIPVDRFQAYIYRVFLIYIFTFRVSVRQYRTREQSLKCGVYPATSTMVVESEHLLIYYPKLLNEFKKPGTSLSELLNGRMILY